MTMSFADQVRDAVVNAERAAHTESARRFRTVLDELVTGLRSLGVGARIQPGRDARKLTLYLYPPHRPVRATPMLTFFLDGGGILVSGETSTTLSSPEELQHWLLQYVQLPAFLETLDVLRGEATLPVEARLRVDDKAAHAVGDVVVDVSPEDQEKLSTTTKGADVELLVKPSEFPGNGAYAGRTNYVLLESAGLLVSVDCVESTKGKLLVKGKRA